MALVDQITAIVRRIDPEFEKEGGSTRHWVRDFFLPALADEGLRVLTDKQIDAIHSDGFRQGFHD
jgi:hypothetical protein